MSKLYEDAEALVSKMTIEEVAKQLKYDAEAVDRLGIPAYNWWNEALHGVARAGTATVFPQAILTAIQPYKREYATIIRNDDHGHFTIHAWGNDMINMPVH